VEKGRDISVAIARLASVFVREMWGRVQLKQVGVFAMGEAPAPHPGCAAFSNDPPGVARKLAVPWGYGPTALRAENARHLTHDLRGQS